MRIFLLLATSLISSSCFAQTLDMKEYFFPLDSLKGEGKTYVYQRIISGDTSINYQQFTYFDQSKEKFIINKLYELEFGYCTEVKLDITRKHLILDYMNTEIIGSDSSAFVTSYSKIQGGHLLKWKTKKGETITYTSQFCDSTASDTVITEWKTSTTWFGNTAPVVYQGKEYQCIVLIRESRTIDNSGENTDYTRITSRQYFAKGIGLVRMENSTRSGDKDMSAYTTESFQLKDIIPGNAPMEWTEK